MVDKPKNKVTLKEMIKTVAIGTPDELAKLKRRKLNQVDRDAKATGVTVVGTAAAVALHGVTGTVLAADTIVRGVNYARNARQAYEDGTKTPEYWQQAGLVGTVRQYAQDNNIPKKAFDVTIAAGKTYKTVKPQVEETLTAAKEELKDLGTRVKDFLSGK